MDPSLIADSIMPQEPQPAHVRPSLNQPNLSQSDLPHLPDYTFCSPNQGLDNFDLLVEAPPPYSSRRRHRLRLLMRPAKTVFVHQGRGVNHMCETYYLQSFR
jgi:hypothetical protein